MQELTQQDIINLLNSFLKEYQVAIIALYNNYFLNKKNNISYRNFIDNIFYDLKSIAIDHINKYNNLDNLNEILFSSINDYCKEHAPPTKIIKYPICPGCLFFNKKTTLNDNKILFCSLCQENFNNEQDPKLKKLYKDFIYFSKMGYKCPDCSRFIPDNILEQIICPYLDCSFIGSKINLKKKRCPTDIYFENDQPFKNKKINLLKNQEKLYNVIQDLINKENWKKSLKVPHRLCALQSFQNILQKEPLEFYNYLINNSRTGGFQHKLFQEYILLLENSFPFLIKRNKKMLTINSLLDPTLSIFEGVSVFESIVNENGEIDNNTQEFYIGGRKGTYSQKYYIGKILNIINAETQEVILQNLQEYSFTKIKINNIKPATKVIVTHLRIPPHYQMGGMVYINRVRKEIIKSFLNQKDDKIEEQKEKI